MLNQKTRKFLYLVGAVVSLAVAFSGFKGNISPIVGGIGWLILGFNYFMDYFQTKAEEKMTADVMKMVEKEFSNKDSSTKEKDK
jgi:hypothetical protein